ncbi:hypothetical protein HanPI659440_Chr14g0567251 [Helianthus annuus]|nr:hypothetical protein HanPI659440_Chr14g0567251 [Helianthus annuus]
MNQYSPSNDDARPIHDGPDIFPQPQMPSEPPVCEAQNQNNESIAQGREKRTRSRPVHLKDYDVKLPPSIDHAPPPPIKNPQRCIWSLKYGENAALDGMEWNGSYKDGKKEQKKDSRGPP